jgi:hypothetical protein
MKLAHLIIIAMCPIIAGCSPSPRTLFKDRNVRALAIAGANGDTNKIDQLIAKGVDVNAVGKDACTPLGWTLVEGNKAGFEHLLKNGADPNTRFDNRSTLLTLAIDTDDPFFLETALKYGGDPSQHVEMSTGNVSLLHYVSVTLQANPDMMRALVKYGANPMPDEDNVSGCAMRNDYENVYILLQAGMSFPTNRTRYKLLERIENRAVHPDDPEYVWLGKVVDFLSDKGIEVTPKEWKKEDQPKIINVVTE